MKNVENFVKEDFRGKHPLIYGGMGLCFFSGGFYVAGTCKMGDAIKNLIGRNSDKNYNNGNNSIPVWVKHHINPLHVYSRAEDCFRGLRKIEEGIYSEAHVFSVRRNTEIGRRVSKIYERFIFPLLSTNGNKPQNC